MRTQPPGEDRRAECFQVRLAGEPIIDPFEPLGGVEEQRRGVVAPSARVDQLGPQQRQLALLQLVERADLRRRDQRVGGVEGGRLELGSCSSERSR